MSSNIASQFTTSNSINAPLLRLLQYDNDTFLYYTSIHIQPATQEVCEEMKWNVYSVFVADFQHSPLALLFITHQFF